MPHSRILFGTDGIRGQANVYPMTVEVALAFGRALAHMVNQGRLGRSKAGHKKRIVIGKDTRLSGYCFEQAIAAGICSMGVDVMLVGPLPTPGIAFITQSMRADAGVVVSASHNPFDDNGIKVFGHDGYKLPDSIEHEIETLILSDRLQSIRPTGAAIGRAVRIDDAVGRYVVYLKSVLSNELSLDGLRIVVDCAHGAAYRVAPDVFRELGAEVICIGVDPDGTNINHEVGALFPQRLQALVLQHNAHLGIALDGDADRAVFVDEFGQVVHGDAVLALLAIDMKERGCLKRNSVVTTIMSGIGLDVCLAQHGISVERTQVGDRYVVERMRDGQFNFGGEDSGHVVVLDYASTGDGIVAALLLLSYMLRQSKPLSVLTQIFTPMPRTLLSVPVAERSPLHELQLTRALIDQVEGELAPNGRVLVRYSGTERKARILVEGLCPDRVRLHAEAIARQLCQETARKIPEAQNSLA